MHIILQADKCNLNAAHLCSAAADKLVSILAGTQHMTIGQYQLAAWSARYLVTDLTLYKMNEALGN